MFRGGGEGLKGDGFGGVRGLVGAAPAYLSIPIIPACQPNRFRQALPTIPPPVQDQSSSYTFSV